MRSRVWMFTVLVAVILVAAFNGIDRAAAGDGSVRFLTAGPVQLGDGHIGHMRVFLSSVQFSTRRPEIHFLGDGGERLATVEVEPPAQRTGPFMEVSFDVKFEGPGQTRFGTLSITDGTSNTIVSKQGSSGIIAILIGLRPEAGGMGTLKITDALGETVGILPYIEQDNLFRFK